MKKLISIILSIFLAISFTSCTKAEAAWQKRYETGKRYISELGYQNKIQSFNSDVDIDPIRTQEASATDNKNTTTSENEEQPKSELVDSANSVIALDPVFVGPGGRMDIVGPGGLPNEIVSPPTNPPANSTPNSSSGETPPSTNSTPDGVNEQNNPSTDSANNGSSEQTPPPTESNETSGAGEDNQENNEDVTIEIPEIEIGDVIIPGIEIVGPGGTAFDSPQFEIPDIEP